MYAKTRYFLLGFCDTRGAGLQLLSAPEEVKARHGLADKGVKDFFYMTCDHGGEAAALIESDWMWRSGHGRVNQLCPLKRGSVDAPQWF